VPRKASVKIETFSSGFLSKASLIRDIYINVRNEIKVGRGYLPARAQSCQCTRWKDKFASLLLIFCPTSS
jgi:hypothetical protein